MSKILDYYESYYKKGGEYSMETHGSTSRTLTLRDWLTKYLKPGDKVLDIGCGDMMLSQHMPEFKWTGIDINIERAKGQATKHNLEATPYPFEADSFDAVVCSEVLEHVWDMRDIHAETHRLLKYEGFYFISTPNFNWIDNKLEGFKRILFNPDAPWTLEHIRQYTPEIHAHFLRLANFEIIDATGADAQFSPFFIEARNVLKKLLVNDCKLEEYNNDNKVDQVIGRMFPLSNHTICIAGRKR